MNALSCGVTGELSWKITGSRLYRGLRQDVRQVRIHLGNIAKRVGRIGQWRGGRATISNWSKKAVKIIARRRVAMEIFHRPLNITLMVLRAIATNTTRTQYKTGVDMQMSTSTYLTALQGARAVWNYCGRRNRSPRNPSMKCA